MNVRWERLSRETVYRGHVVDVHVDRVRIEADGETRETEYDVVHHPGAASVVPLFGDGTVALIRQLRYAVGGEILEIPAGSLHEGESFEACARREIEEEIGWRASRWTTLATFYTTPGFSDEEMRCFLAENLEPGERALDDDEHLEVVRMGLDEAVAAIAAGAVRDAKSIVGLLAARARLEEEDRWPLPGGAA